MGKIIETEERPFFHPGCYAEDYIKELKITNKEFALMLNVEEKTLNDFINGNIDVDEEFAGKLSEGMGISKQSWINLQARFDEYKKHVAINTVIE